jgi:GAF domain-containing protein
MRSWRRGRSAYERLRKLQSVMESALAHLTLDELLDELLERVRGTLEADTAAVLILNEETNELVARAAKGIEEEVERRVRIPLGAGFAGRVAATRQSVSIEDVEHAEVAQPHPARAGHQVPPRTPLISRDRVLGVLRVGTLTNRIFTADDRDLLEIGEGVSRSLSSARSSTRSCSRSTTSSVSSSRSPGRQRARPRGSPGPHRRRGWQRSHADHRHRPRPGRGGRLRLAPLRSLLPLSGIERQGRRGPRPGDRASYTRRLGGELRYAPGSPTGATFTLELPVS